MKKTIISILLIAVLQNCGSSTTYNPPVQETVNVSPLKAEDQTLTEEITSKENSIDDEYTYVVDRSSSAKTNQKSKNNKMFVYVAGGIVIAAVVAGTILFFINTNKAKQAETTAQATKKATKVVETVVDELTQNEQVLVIINDIKNANNFKNANNLSKTLESSFNTKDPEAFRTALEIVAGSQDEVFTRIIKELGNPDNTSISSEMRESLISVVKQAAQTSQSIVKDTWKTALTSPKVQEVLVKVGDGIKHNAKFVENISYIVGGKMLLDSAGHVLSFFLHAH